jgi:hypothetical protein
MVAILNYIKDQAAFEPEATRAMAQAFNEACAALHISPDSPREREVIATRIIDLARAGVIDAKALRDRVLQEAQAKA